MLLRNLRLLLVMLPAVAAAACGSTNTSVVGPTPSRCAVSLSASASAFDAAGGSGNVSVSTDRDCTWSATSGAAWITLSGSTSGQGPGSFQFSVAGNAAASARNGAISVNGQPLTITEQGSPCHFVVSPAVVSVASAGGAVNISVQGQSSCAWTAASGVPWISISSGASGTGNGTVQLVVDTNPGALRTGTVTVGGETVTVNQSDGTTPPPPPPPPSTCSYLISPTSRNFPAAGGNGSVSVTTTANCSWTAASPVTWVTITSGAQGTGSGSVSYTVDPNTTTARSTTLTIAGQSFLITQDAPAVPNCSYSVDPNKFTVSPTAATYTIAVTTTTNCSWTATSNDSWISVAPGSSSGTGSGVVVFAVDTNTGGTRNGSLTVAGRDVSVKQSGANAEAIGPVSSLAGSCPDLRFSILADRVLTSSSTLFSKGPCSKVDNGVLLDVLATVQADLTLLATVVTFQK